MDGGKKRKDKSQMTEEERRIRKEEKRRRKEENAAVTTICGYSNDDNRFGDRNLTEQFVWGKKIEKAKALGEPVKQYSSEQQRREEVEREVRKVKERREQRERELAMMEEERMRVERAREMAGMGDWQQRDSEFHLEQAKKRAQIRIKEGRAKPIDIIAKNLAVDVEDDILDLEMTEPYKLFKDLSLPDLLQLKEDISAHAHLDSERNSKFWDAMAIVCADEIATAQRREELQRLGPSGRRGLASGVNDQVQEEAESMMQGKSFSDLVVLEKEINETIALGGASVDAEFWEAMLARLKIAKAKATLRDIHRQLLEKRLELLQQEQKNQQQGGSSSSRGRGIYDGAMKSASNNRKAPAAASGENSEDEIDLNDTEGQSPLRSKSEQKKHQQQQQHEADGEIELPMEDDDTNQHRHSLEIAVGADGAREFLLDGEDNDDDEARPPSPRRVALKANEVAADPEEDARQLARARMHILTELAAKARQAMEEAMASSAAEDAMFSAEASKAMEDGEVQFSAEVEEKDRVYWWHDKYRPRKPRYFNRVHTGYDWNLYNRTHYDHDNPPPKVVQGYKFNIFYPDLIDKSKAPTYKLLPDVHPETCILRFSAGPPYEDISFRIVNKEWEFSHKHGFRCTFDRGILHLYFHFKRHRYRR